jgi:hypothetical protein
MLCPTGKKKGIAEFARESSVSVCGGHVIADKMRERERERARENVCEREREAESAREREREVGM